MGEGNRETEREWEREKEREREKRKERKNRSKSVRGKDAFLELTFCYRATKEKISLFLTPAACNTSCENPM